MKKLMMQRLIKDERFYEPEYIVSTHLCKIESGSVVSVFFSYNLATNIKLVNLKSFKVIDIAHYGNDDHHCMSWQVNCQRTFPHTFGKYGVFPIAFKIYELKVSFSRDTLLLSCLSQTKHSNIANTCFAREP